jgi:carbohydrate-binding DOMON domain-containing protein
MVRVMCFNATFNNISVSIKVPSTQTHRAAQHIPGWWIGKTLLMGGYHTEILTVVIKVTIHIYINVQKVYKHESKLKVE